MKIIRLLFLTGILALGASCQLPDKVDWEYRTVVVNDDTTAHGKPLDAALDGFTAEGWTVVRFDPNPDNPQNEWKVVLKRPKK